MHLKNILLRGPNWVGDAVLSVPAMKALRANFPSAELTLLVRPWVAGVFTSASFVDRIWVEPKPSGPGDWWRLTREIRRRHFDLALLFPNSFESAAMVLLGGVPQRVGYATEGRGLLLTKRIRIREARHHQVDYYLQLARAIAPDTGAPSTEIQASVQEREQARRLLVSAGIARDRRFLVINPGAAYGSAKRWGTDRFAEAADVLAAEFDLDVAIVGSERERSIGEEVRGRMRRGAAVLNGETSLETLLGVIAESALVLTNDSGPMHISAALGVPTVAVFGPTDDIVTGPCGPRSRVVREPVDCSPCMLRECPIDHRCMTRVTAEAVCRAAREVLGA
jgi:heptosyltransferase-2